MKILHLTTHLNQGGITQYISSVGNLMIKEGHRVAVASSGGEMEDEFRRAGLGIKIFPIRTKSELSPKIYQAIPGFTKWVKEESFDVLHAHTRVTQVLGFWVSRQSGIPLVTTVHGFYKRRLGRRLLPAWGTRAIAISEAVGVDLRQTHKVPESRVRVVYNGVDIEKIRQNALQQNSTEVRKEYKIPESVPILGITARLVEDKGHSFLIRAMKDLETDFPELRLIIVGEGRMRTKLEMLVRELGLTERVIFTGSLKDISKALSIMDFFVLPATWREGFGLSIAEAMVCGKPVIVSNIWALNTLIENGVNGLLVEPKNVRALADGIRSLLNNPELRERIGRKGRETAEKRFTLNRMVKEITAVYEEVL